MSTNIVLRSIIIIALFGFFTSCASRGLPTKEESLAIKADQKVIILLRTSCKSEKGKPLKAFSSFGEGIHFNLISLETEGEIKFISPRWLSREGREEGWVYFMLEPGTTYLYFQGGGAPTIRPGDFNIPRWLVDIPIKSDIVYIGTLHLQCRPSAFKWCFYIIKGWIENEEALARKMAALYFPNITSFQTVLIRRDDSPTIILRKPKGE